MARVLQTIQQKLLSMMLPKERHKQRRQNSINWRLVLHQIDNELERCARELIAYLDNEAEVERALPSSVGFMVKQMRAAIFAKAMRTLAPAQRCRIYRHCRPSQ
jgi:hypothetical protein